MNKPTAIEAPITRTASLLARTILVAAILIAADSPRALAEVRVQGGPDAVRLEAIGSSVEEALTALGKAFGLRYRTSIGLDRTLTGVYQGPLDRVLARVLDSYDFITKSSAGGGEVVILAERGGAASAARAAAAPGAATGMPPPAAMVPTPVGPAPAQNAAPPPSGE